MLVNSREVVVASSYADQKRFHDLDANAIIVAVYSIRVETIRNETKTIASNAASERRLNRTSPNSSASQKRRWNLGPTIAATSDDSSDQPGHSMPAGERQGYLQYQRRRTIAWGYFQRKLISVIADASAASDATKYHTLATHVLLCVLRALSDPTPPPHCFLSHSAP